MMMEKRIYGEVFTPLSYINDNIFADMGNYYMNTYKLDIFAIPSLTWYDPAAGMGNFPIALYYKLMNGLKSKMPDEKARKKHIIENMIYMAEINKRNYMVIRKIFNSKGEYKLNLYNGDSLTIDLMKVFKRNKFDIIIGNPPYNKPFSDTGAGASPLYNEFIDMYMDKCQMMTYVVPSRWFAGGKGLDDFRQRMLDRTDIVYIRHVYNASEIFGHDVHIGGGVNHFLIDHKYKGKCDFNGDMLVLNQYDIIVNSQHHDIVDKMREYDSLTDIYMASTQYDIQTNDNRLKQIDANINMDDYAICYVARNKGHVNYIHKTEITKPYDYYKVIASAISLPNGGFGNVTILNKTMVYSKTYIGFKVKTRKQADSLASYMRCRLPNYLLSLRKISIHVSKSTIEWIPLPELDREWTDNMLYKYYNLTKADIAVINNTKIAGLD